MKGGVYRMLTLQPLSAQEPAKAYSEEKNPERLRRAVFFS